MFEIDRLTHRDDPIYHSTYTGKPPDEPAVLGVALNEVFVPILQKQFPEIVDFYLPPEGCSYRMAIVSHPQSATPATPSGVMFGVWSFLRQFMYTKFIVVTDDDVDVRDWKEVVWAITTRMDPVRDTTLVDHTPIDYLDFASPVSGLGGKMGLDATNKWPGETAREWGRPIRRTPPSRRGSRESSPRSARRGPADPARATQPARRAQAGAAFRRRGAARLAAGADAAAGLGRRPAAALPAFPDCSPSDMPISTPLTSAE